MNRKPKRDTPKDPKARAHTLASRDRIVAAAVVLTGWSSYFALPFVTGSNTGRVVAVFAVAACWLALKGLGVLPSLPLAKRPLAAAIAAFGGCVVLSSALSPYAPRALTWGSLGFFGAPLWLALCVIFWGTLHLDEELLTPGLVAAAFSWSVPALAYALYQTAIGTDATGGFNTGNHLAAIAVLVAPIALWVALSAHGLLRTAGALTSVGALVGIIIAGSSAGYLGLGVAAIALVLLHPRPLGLQPAPARRFRIGIVILALCVTSVLVLGLVMPEALPAPVSRSLTGTVYGDTYRTRVEMWRAAGGIVAERPLFGAGADSYHLAAQRHLSARIFRIESGTGVLAVPPDPHSLPVLLAASFGLVGLVAALVVAALWLVRVRKQTGADDRVAPVSLRVYAAAASVGFIAVLLFVPLAALLGAAPVLVAAFATLSVRGEQTGAAESAGAKGPRVWRAACWIGVAAYVALLVPLVAAVVQADAASNAATAEDGQAAYAKAAQAMPTYPFWTLRSLQVEGEQLREDAARLNDWQRRVDARPDLREDGTYLTILARASLDQAFRWSRGDLAWEQSQLAEAEDVFPGSPEIKLERAHLALLKGDLEEAGGLIEDVRRSAPRTNRLDLYRYYLAAAQGDGSAAELRELVEPQYGPLALLEPQPASR